MPARRLLLRIVWLMPGLDTGADAAELLGWRDLPDLSGRRTEFGLQRRRADILPGAVQPDGTLRFETQVEPYVDKAGRQRFRGECVQGPTDEPFLYLSWRLAGETSWLGRRKVDLGTLTEEVLGAFPESVTLQTEVAGLGHRPAGHVQVWAE